MQTLQLPPTSRISRSPSPSAPPPLHLVIRFSNSLPDLNLDILSPHRTTVVALKHQIRARLIDGSTTSTGTGRDSTDSTSKLLDSSTNNNHGESTAAIAARSRLRFIHAGKILPDAAVLSAVLKPPPPPPSTRSSKTDPKGKGKGVEGRGTQRVFVNCSIGEELSAKDLAEEAAAAAAPPPPPLSPSPLDTPTSTGNRGRGGLQLSTNFDTSSQRSSPHVGGPPGPPQQQQPAPAPAPPRGFDRFLTAGFTRDEVAQLRHQFRSIQESRHTPDTMPSPDTLRSMEDAWIDNNNNPSSFNLLSGGGGRPSSFDDDNQETADLVGGAANNRRMVFGLHLDDLVHAVIVGFMFPLGSLGWLWREEGLWSKDWGVYVSFGVLLSVGVGVLRSLTGG